MKVDFKLFLVIFKIIWLIVLRFIEIWEVEFKFFLLLIFWIKVWVKFFYFEIFVYFKLFKFCWIGCKIFVLLIIVFVIIELIFWIWKVILVILGGCKFRNLLIGFVGVMVEDKIKYIWFLLIIFLWVCWLVWEVIVLKFNFFLN